MFNLIYPLKNLQQLNKSLHGTKRFLNTQNSMSGILYTWATNLVFSFLAASVNKEVWTPVGWSPFYIRANVGLGNFKPFVQVFLAS